MEIAIERSKACSITTSRDYMLPAVIKSLLNKFLFTLYVSHPPSIFFLLVLLIEHNTVDIRCFNFSYIFARIYSSANRVAISQISSFSLALYCAWKSHLEFLSLDSSDQIKWILRHSYTTSRAWLENFHQFLLSRF